ncbi:MAG TPA: flagellar biosynthesis anti-sigma factor FlgM [Verrucomicrobiae bacterium]|jgi:hypothetical protein
MRIKQNKITVTDRNNRKAGKAGTRASGHVLPLSGENHHLHQALANEPDVRAEQVARGKALIADPNYPSQAQLKKIAGLLAENLSHPVGPLDSSVANTGRLAITTVAA